MNGAAQSYTPQHHHHQQGYVDNHHMGPPAQYAYPHYQHYPASTMPTHVSSYAPHHGQPPQYAYGAHMAPAQHPSQHYSSYPHPPPNHTIAMTLPAISVPPSSGPSASTAQDYPTRLPDTTGQISPPGLSKPKVTATLWEDEGTLCFQVETDGICVARRQDNAMINGTKLLNVARMTRGRRDGILKSEKNRRVIKIGPMHLKGVWITYERALEFANKEKITESLYPLFVHNIDQHLHHHGSAAGGSLGGDPSRHMNAVRAGQPKESQLVLSQQQQQQQQQPPPTTMSQHHSAATSTGSHPSQASHTVPSQPAVTRPSIDRAHTYPAPPPANPSNVMAVGPAGGSYGYDGLQSTPSSQQHFAKSESMPATPITTPPDNNGAAAMHQPYSTAHGYDVPRTHSISVPPAQQSPYHVGSGYPYSKTEMGPPGRAVKDGEEDTQSGYEHDRAYGYHHGQVAVDSAQVSPLTKSSPHTAPGQPTPHSTGAITPQNQSQPQGQWNPTYSTPARAQTLPSTSLSYAGVANNSGYPTPGPNHGYAYSNGVLPSNKRGRDADDDDEASAENGSAAKRRREIHEMPKARAHLSTRR